MALPAQAVTWSLHEIHWNPIRHARLWHGFLKLVPLSMKGSPCSRSGFFFCGKPLPASCPYDPFWRLFMSVSSHSVWRIYRNSHKDISDFSENDRSCNPWKLVTKQSLVNSKKATAFERTALPLKETHLDILTFQLHPSKIPSFFISHSTTLTPTPTKPSKPSKNKNVAKKGAKSPRRHLVVLVNFQLNVKKHVAKEGAKSQCRHRCLVNLKLSTQRPHVTLSSFHFCDGWDLESWSSVLYFR